MGLFLMFDYSMESNVRTEKRDRIRLASGTAPKHRSFTGAWMSSHENTAPKADVYRKVTDAIVDAIESGIGHYQMLWTVRQERGFGPISVGSVKVAASNRIPRLSAH